MKRCSLIACLSVASLLGVLNRPAGACPVQLGVVAVPVQVLAVAPVVTSSAVAVPAIAAPSIAVLSAPAVVTTTPIVVQQVLRVRTVPRFRTPVPGFLFGR